MDVTAERETALRAQLDHLTVLVDLYERVHCELDDGKEWSEIDNGLRKDSHAPKTYEYWQSYMQQGIILNAKALVHLHRQDSTIAESGDNKRG